jgi:LysR substrate binding domain-containing protein
VMIAESHPLAGAREVSLADLAGTPILLTPREINPALHDAVIGACRTAGFEPEVLALPRERGYLPRAMFDGRAFTVWPTLSPPEYVRKGLVTVPLREPRPRLETRLLHRRGTDGPGLRLLRDLVGRSVRALAQIR